MIDEEFNSTNAPRYKVRFCVETPSGDMFLYKTYNWKKMKVLANEECWLEPEEKIQFDGKVYMVDYIYLAFGGENALSDIQINIRVTTRDPIEEI